MMDTKNPQASTSGGCRGFPRGEESRPFPRMAESPSPPPSGIENLDNYNSGGEENGTADEGSGGLSDGDVSPGGGVGVHPGDSSMFNFPSGEGGQGGPVRLTNLTPISPTNEDVYGSTELRSNPQPPISMLSPSRAGPQGTIGYPFLLSAGGHPPIFSVTENEKFRKLMLKKQKRDSKKEKNVKVVFKAEDVEGHKHTQDIDSILQSLGEKEKVNDKKLKSKKPKEKQDKQKLDKKDRGRRSVEKELDGKVEEEEEDLKVEAVRRGTTPDIVTSDLLDFKNNFYLVAPSPEPGPLARTKSREVLVASTESLTQFTKVTKKHRNKRSKEEPNPTKPPPPPAPPEVKRTSGYNLRSREVPREIVSPPPEVQEPVWSESFPVLGKEDFPELPGGKKVIDAPPRLASAWVRVATKSSGESVDDTTVKSEVEASVPEDIEEVKDEASDSTAVIECDVPSISDIIDNSDADAKDLNNELSSEEKDSTVSDSELKTDANETTESLTSELLHSEEVAADVEVSRKETEKPQDLANQEVNTTMEQDIEVVATEDEFNRKKADNSAAVVILGDSDQDWRSSEFSFGFDINEDLVANGVSGDVGSVGAQIVGQMVHPQLGPYYPGLAPGAPLTPIDSVDGAIISFGGPDSSLRPLLVGVPVGVPVPVTLTGGALHYFPPSFPHYSLPFPMTGPLSAPPFQDQEEPELEVEHKEEEPQDPQEHQTISPESGISSASPLSWQPDSSPSLPAPGSYPHPLTNHNSSPPLVNLVHQSLSSWQGHSTSSSPSNSSRNSPTPGWTIQTEDISMIRNKKEASEETVNCREEDREVHEDENDDDSGLALESGSDNSVELGSSKEKFNLGEIVTFISSSWSSVSKDSSVTVYSNTVGAS